MPNFNSANEGTWFYFCPDHKEFGGVCLRELTIDESNRITQLTVKHKKRVMQGVFIDDTKTDEKRASKLRWDFCITDWKEVILDGQTLECNADNKVRMMKVIDFVKHVVVSLNDLVDMNKSLEESRLKNLPNSSNGSAKELDS